MPALIERHAPVIQQISVVHLVERAVVEQELDVRLKPVAAEERALQPLHDKLLLLAQPVRVRRVHSREICVQKPVGLSRARVIRRVWIFRKCHRPLFVVDKLHNGAVLHMEFRPLLCNLPLQLKLNDGDRLVDLHVEAGVLRLVLCADRAARILDLEAAARIILVCLQGKGSQRQKIDAVPVLQRVQISIAGTDADHIGDAAQLAGRSAHPHEVMIAPLNIEAVVLHQLVHDVVGPASPVVDIAEDMQMIDRQLRNQLRERNNKDIGALDADNRIDDLLVVRLLVLDVVLLGDQLLDDKCKVIRQLISHLLTRVLARRIFADGNQAVQHDLVPVLHFRLCPGPPDKLDLLLRIINQGGELPDIALRESPAKHLGDLLSDGARAVLQYVRESLVLSVNIRNKMLCSLRQAQRRRQVDDFRGRLRDRRIDLRQALQVFPLKFIHVHLPRSGTVRRDLQTW